ncbi:hypothetical protein H4S07_007031 [Coemansia furcata]|uniref:Uncharacterized protein n=1 Tax=Coemansia furcata TaxID=417177 RepID=A0ACC1KR51_9FUNG|nr:hypothetical protein H4S07_007031 [Coemansia furcata]
MDFQSAGPASERHPFTASRDDYRAGKYDRYSAPQSRANSGAPAVSRQAPASAVQGNTIEDAIQRARQIAQHLGVKKQ